MTATAFDRFKIGDSALTAFGKGFVVYLGLFNREEMEVYIPKNNDHVDIDICVDFVKNSRVVITEKRIKTFEEMEKIARSIYMRQEEYAKYWGREKKNKND